MSTYRYYNINDGHYYYTNELPEEGVMPNSVGINAGIVDMNYEPLYTGDIIKHYIASERPDAYDIGVIFCENDTFYRTTTILGYDKFKVSEKCGYLKLGDTTDNLSVIAARLWTTLSHEQKMAYYHDNGVIGFLEDFELPRKDGENETLTREEIEYALDLISDMTRVD